MGNRASFLAHIAVLTLTVFAQNDNFEFSNKPSLLLKPIAPPGHAKGHIGTLNPRSEGKHFWTPNGEELDDELATMFAEANITYQHPTVILPHSNLIRYTFCLNDGIQIGFRDNEAYRYAKSQWSVDAASNDTLMIITESLHCNAADIGHHVYWMVSKLDFDDAEQGVVATAEEVPLTSAFNDVQMAWGSTNPHDDPLGGGGTHLTANAHGEVTSRPRHRGPPPGRPSKRQQPAALFQPWFANSEWNETRLQHCHYFFTPLAGTSLSPADRFTVITVAPYAGSNTTGYLVYGYGGQSANQIQPNNYYAISSPARPLAPGYSLQSVAPGACPVPLVSYIFREPATFPDIQAPKTRDGFNVTAWAQTAGLGQPIGVNMIAVVNGPYPASCDAKPVVSASSSVLSSSSSGKSSSVSKTSMSSSASASTSIASRSSSSASGSKSSASSTISSSASKSSSNASLSSSTGSKSLSTSMSSSSKSSSASGASSSLSSKSSASSTAPSVIPSNPSCANPPDSYMGVPAAPCGPNFDAVKDAKVGFFDFNTEADAGTFIGRIGKRGLDRRYSFGDFLDDLKGAAHSVYDGLKNAAEAAAKLATEVYNSAKDTFTNLVNTVADTLSKPVVAPFAQSIPIDYKPGKKVDSPWGTADSVLLYSTNKTKGAGGDQSGLIAALDVYCKDCGFKGTTIIYGELAFKIIPTELNALKIGIKGDLSTTLNIGIEASLTYNKIYKRNLFTEAVPDAGIAVADMFILGFVLTGDAIISFKSKISGNVLVGGSMDINGFDASVDILHGSGAQSGWTPKFKFDPSKNFQASGTVTASLAISLPIEFVFGIEIIPLDFKKVLGIRQQAMLTGSTQLQVGTASSTTGGTCPNGVSYSLDFIESVDFDQGGTIKNLYEYKADGIIAGCYKPAASLIVFVRCD